MNNICLKNFLGLNYDPRYYQNQAYHGFFNGISNPENYGLNPLIVLPTGAGKSLVQAMIIKRMIQFANTRVLLLTHQSELIKQNYNELFDNCMGNPFFDVGIYSAGLKRRDTKNRVLFAGIQSVYRKAWELGFFDLIIIDEVHRVSRKSKKMYGHFLSDMKEINPRCIITGLTATEFRLKSGLLHEGEDRMFHYICHKTTITELINPDDPRNLDNKQYLCNLVSTPAENQADMSKVGDVAGEYNQGQMQEVFLENDLIRKAVSEIVEKASERKKILVFTAGIDHCEKVTEELIRQGFSADFTHSKRGEKTNDKAISDFKEGRIKCLVNVDKLTTGFNEKRIDCIVLLRGTKSASLLIQMIGRGSRLHPDKLDCLVLDFAGNIDYFGPIDKIEVKSKKPKSSQTFEVPTKDCPECGNPGLHISVKVCPTCGYKFGDGVNHDETASTEEIISTIKPLQEYNIDHVSYDYHYKKGKPRSVKVSYYTEEGLIFRDYICIEHGGGGTAHARNWLKLRLPEHIAAGLQTSEDVYKISDQILNPFKITVDINPKYPVIKGYSFEVPDEPDESDNSIIPVEEIEDVSELIF